MPEPQDRLSAALADRYRVERELGRGGMATVYLARDLKHDRPVALKVLHPELAATVGPERFLREIRTAARLQHPHILPLHDSGEAGGLLYYVMPFVEGESLRDRLSRETQLPIEEATRLAREVADALAYAHGQGIIHRDIKPENILLSGGHALVADFGIGRAVGASGGEQLTATGMAMGTPAYMSPEQAVADPALDGRSDVYSLGCVFYEMLAGEPPFTGPTPQAIIARRFTEAPRALHLVRETIPGHLGRVVTRALARSPADRFATAAEFARALDTPMHEAPGGVAGSAGVPASRRRALLIAGLALLLGLGALFAWRRSQAGGARAGAAEAAGVTRRLAVLPFENLGDTSTAYFADGMTDEVRGKLAEFPELQVIARASSNQYRHATNRPEVIARELGVHYLLTGTVRTDKGVNGAPGRVRVSPELVQLIDGAAVTKWQQPFDAVLSDVFRVQAEIAARVAQALGVTFGAGNEARLAERPTANLAAYDAYLQGEEVARGLAAEDPENLRRSIRHYERAVALDSTFVAAWARLAAVQALLYASVPGTVQDAAARRAAERVRALAPGHPESRLALGIYYAAVERDPPKAAEQFALGLRAAPNDAELLTASAQVEWSLGRWAEALAHLRRAAALDPRSVNTALKLGQTLVWLRRYPEAREALERALALAPDNLEALEMRAMAELGRGDLAAARAVLRSAPAQVEPAALATYVALFWDLGWALDRSAQQLLLSSGPEVFGDDRMGWALVQAQLYALRNDARRARLFADSALAAVEAALNAAPEDGQLHAFRGLALAYLGHRDEAVRAGKRGVELLPVSKHAYYGPYIQHQLARIYLMVGEPERALDQLEPLLEIPYYLSPGWLRIDPTFDPLRQHPRFRRLVAGRPAGGAAAGANPQPALATTATTP